MTSPVIIFRDATYRVKKWAWNHSLMRHRPVKIAAHVVTEMITRDANHLAAGVAYYSIFGIFPFLLGMMVISGLFLEAEIIQAKLLEFVMGNLPGSDRLIASNIIFIDSHRVELILIAVAGILWSSSSVFGAISRVVNRAWGIYQGQPFHVHRMEHIMFLFTFGLYFFFWLVVTSFSQVLLNVELGATYQQAIGDSGVLNTLVRLASWLVTAVGFLLIYRYLPNCEMKWRYVWAGTLVASLLFEVGKEIFNEYLRHYGQYDVLYGSIASTIVFLLWVFLSALILTLGAEICSNYQQAYHPEEKIDRMRGWSWTDEVPHPALDIEHPGGQH
ncbi:MAG: YihY/virulence factor BrkB family protein [Chloroflexi bacterium]|nr:YihY/virulence factor BrkB family protein [Chloroflexota bacterium]